MWKTKGYFLFEQKYISNFDILGPSSFHWGPTKYIKY